jgi:hypothetical protein
MDLKKLSEITMTKVSSNNVAKLGYDELQKVLVVEFHSGARYAYSPITREGYKLLIDAESIGKFLHANITTNDKVEFCKLEI